MIVVLLLIALEMASSDRMKNEIQEFAGRFKLSPRETEVLGLLADRIVSLKDISAKLSISPSTVKNHLNSIFDKTKTSGKSELIGEFMHYLFGQWRDRQLFERTPTVLVVDDEPELCEILKKSLEERGLRVQVATHPSEAFDAIYSNEIDFVVSDIRMPGFDGIELLKKARTLHRTRPAFAMITGASGYRKDEVMDYGAVGMMTKPIDYDALYVMILESVLDQEKLLPLSKTEVIARPFDESLHLEAEQVGVGGFFLPMESLRMRNSDFTEGARIKFQAILNGALGPVDIIGEVAWVRPEKIGELEPGAGVRFLYLTDDASHCVEEVLKETKTISFIPMAKQASSRVG